MKKIVQLTLALMAATFVSYAQAGVLYMGTVSLTDSRDRDVLHLGLCATTANRPVNALQLQINDFPAEIDRLEVKYQNGQTDELYVKEHFLAGQNSRWIDLEGGKRCIKKITIVGDTDTLRRAPLKQAKISFFGRD